MPRGSLLQLPMPSAGVQGAGRGQTACRSAMTALPQDPVFLRRHYDTLMAAAIMEATAAYLERGRPLADLGMVDLWHAYIRATRAWASDHGNEGKRKAWVALCCEFALRRERPPRAAVASALRKIDAAEIAAQQASPYRREEFARRAQEVISPASGDHKM